VPCRLSVRLPNWLGDTVMAVPALRALREALTGTEILLAGPWARLLDGQGLADALVAYPRSWRGRFRAAGRIRDFDGATVLLLPNSLEAAAAAVLWGGRRRVGFARGGRSWLLTDAVPPPDGERTPQQVFKDELYEIYYRFLETEDEYFDYAPAPVPPQGRWRIYGIGLPDAILKKVYHENAERLLGLSR